MEILSISSTQNDLVKYCVKLQNPKFRKSQKVIFLDGEKTISGLIDDGYEFEYVFLKKDNILFNKINSKKIVEATDSVLKKISTTASQCSIAGIIKEPEIDINIFKNLNKIVLLDSIKDAGNLGTIIRSACAFSMDGILLFGDCVDLYNSKVIRSSTQNMFKIPVIATKDLNFINELRKTHPIISTVVDSKDDFMDFNFKDKFVLALGSEAFGISKEIENISDKKLSLKMDKDVESINLAICASIAFALIKFNLVRK